MVTQYEGKGLGVIAARDIKMGEAIFTDNLALKVPATADSTVIIQSLKEQIENLSSEAKIHLDKLQNYNVKLSEASGIDGVKELGLFLNHAKYNDVGGWMVIFLNAALINHSCSPNANVEQIQIAGDPWCEVRAIRGISKGEEVTTCYTSMLGYNSQERRAELREHLFCDCKCSVCTGIIPNQEDLIKELIDSHGRFALFHASEEASFEAEAVQIAGKIVDLTKELYMGPVEDKVTLLKPLLASANKVHREKAQEALKKLAEDTGIGSLMRFCEESELMK